MRLGLSQLSNRASPFKLLCQYTRPFSATAAPSQPSNPAANILSLDQKPTQQPAAGVQNLFRERARAKTEANLTRQRAVRQQEQERKTSDEYMRQMGRKWKAGDVYAPRDLHPHQLERHRRRSAPTRDVVDVLNLNPLDHYKNFSMISEFMTSFGQIKHSKDTGLRPKNQRKMAKAIRRVIGMGIHPSVHYHPELIKRQTRGKW